MKAIQYIFYGLAALMIAGVMAAIGGIVFVLSFFLKITLLGAAVFFGLFIVVREYFRK